MRLSLPAMGRACALLVLASCSTDEPQTEAGLGPTIRSAAAVSAYNIVKVPAMTIDGNLNDWATITAISMADNSGRAAGLDNTAKVKLAWDDTYLYAAYDVTDTELLAVQTTRDHADIYKDDEVELYIDPQGDGGTATKMTPTDYHFLANVRNALGDNKGTTAGGQDASYTAASFLAMAVPNGTLNASGTDVGYTVEIRISWGDLGVTPAAGKFMRLDLAVGDSDTGNTTTQEFDWSGLSSFNNPSGWRDVQLVAAPPPISAYDIVKVSSMIIDGNLNDWTGVTSISMADNSGRAAGLDNTAKVKLAWDDTYLYAAYDVTDTELLAVQTTRDHADIYKDDEVELYIDPQGDGGTATKMTPTDYHFLANVRNALGDNKGTTAGGQDASYNAAGFLAQAVTNGTLNATGTDLGYTIEMRIAWSDLGVSTAAGKFMRIDLAIGDRDGSAASTEEFDWAGLSSFNNPSGWKNVKLVVDASAPAAPTNPALTVASSSQINVTWTASTSTDVAKYNIYRGTTGTPTLLTSVSGSPYQNTGLTQGTSYTYQISAVDAGGNESPKTAPQSATTQTTQAGIPFGLWGLLPDTMPSGTIWTGGVLSDKSPTGVLTRLAAARSKSPRIGMWFKMAGGSQSGYMNANGSFNVQSWKDSLDRGHGGTIQPDGTSSYYLQYLPYIQDGTFQGIVLLDDLGAFTPYPTFAEVEAIAAHAKLRFPALATSVRERATFLESQHGGAVYTKLDAAWAQYRSDRGSSASYRDLNIAAAKRLKLGLVLGVNITNGLRNGVVGGDYVPPDSLLIWGNEFLKAGASFSDYACGFFMWSTADYPYLTHVNMTTLANKAKTHVAAPCKRR